MLWFERPTLPDWSSKNTISRSVSHTGGGEEREGKERKKIEGREGERGERGRGEGGRGEEGREREGRRRERGRERGDGRAGRPYVLGKSLISVILCCDGPIVLCSTVVMYLDICIGICHPLIVPHV